eukprot:45387-Hanusia_phi.AAC.2
MVSWGAEKGSVDEKEELLVEMLPFTPVQQKCHDLVSFALPEHCWYLLVSAMCEKERLAD